MTQINLSEYPAPKVLKDINYETILDEIKENFISRFPLDEITAAEKNIPTQAKARLLLTIEGNLVLKNLEAYAYHATQMWARINDASKSMMLAYATGSDLENLGAFYGVHRKVIVEADTMASPPVDRVVETDTDLRARIVIAVDGLSTAGPVGAYKFHGLSASADVKDVAISSPIPGQVLVTVLSHSGTGDPPQETLDTVLAALNDEDVRPLTDQVLVQAATVTEYEIVADIWCYGNVDSAVVRQASHDAAVKYADDMHRLGYDVTDSGMKRALHQPGVQSVDVTSPAATIVNGPAEASYCTGVTVTYRGIDV